MEAGLWREDTYSRHREMILEILDGGGDSTSGLIGFGELPSKVLCDVRRS